MGWWCLNDCSDVHLAGVTCSPEHKFWQPDAEGTGREKSPDQQRGPSIFHEHFRQQGNGRVSHWKYTYYSINGIL